MADGAANGPVGMPQILSSWNEVYKMKTILGQNCHNGIQSVE